MSAGQQTGHMVDCGYRISDGRSGRRFLTMEEAAPVLVALPREAMQRVYELVVARAVTLEAGEEANLTGLGSDIWRVPADIIADALAKHAAEAGR